jgi:hypothetical protein
MALPLVLIVFVLIGFMLLGIAILGSGLVPNWYGLAILGVIYVSCASAIVAEFTVIAVFDDHFNFRADAWPPAVFIGFGLPFGLFWLLSGHILRSRRRGMAPDR